MVPLRPNALGHGTDAPIPVVHEIGMTLAEGIERALFAFEECVCSLE
jgi:hypothetical protein